MTYKAVLFDLDGTLLDTIGDLCFALNVLREEFHLPPVTADFVRETVSDGSKPMVKAALQMDVDDPRFETLRQKFLTIYDTHLADSTNFFPGMSDVLDYIEAQQLPWGIVTNKMTRHTMSLLKALSIEHRPQCVVCGDTLKVYKPHPGPVLHACELLNQSADDALFIGDSIYDVLAGKAAGVKSLVALYGYIGPKQNPYAWHADGYIQHPDEIISWLR